MSTRAELRALAEHWSVVLSGDAITRRGDTHYEGCEYDHWRCAMATLTAALAGPIEADRERRLEAGIVAAGEALSYHCDMDEAYRLPYVTLRDVGCGDGGEPFEDARRALANRQEILDGSPAPSS